MRIKINKYKIYREKANYYFDLRKMIIKIKRRSDWVIYNVKKGGVTSTRKAITFKFLSDFVNTS